jgi:hypothetical protein
MSVYNISGQEISGGGETIIPYYLPSDQTNQYADNRMNASQFYALYDAMVGTKSDGYKVTKTLVGRDQSDTYDIYKYVFEPAEYERTILLSSGMHGIEITPMFTLLTMMQSVYAGSTGIELFDYLHNSVRVVVIPLQNPWGFSQPTRIYPNSRWVNENKNFGIKSEWEAFNAPAYGNTSNPYQGKGTAPFSEAETVNMRAVLYEYMHDIDFWFDLHSSMGWDYDYYVQCNANDKYMHDAISDALENSVKPYLKNVLGISNLKELFNDPDTALKLHYAYKVLNVSCCTVEMTPQRFGGSECGSMDLKVYQQQFGSYLIGALNHFKPRSKANNNHRYAQNNVLQAPNGTWYKVDIANDGTVATTEM